MTMARAAAAVVPLISLLAGPTAGAEAPDRFALASPAFSGDGEIPTRYTCEDRNISPPLSWSGPPEGTVSFVLIVENPGPPAPMTPRMSWVHWSLYNLPADARGLAENVTRAILPPRVGEGRNDWALRGYQGPCPPTGTHRYIFTLYALDTALPELWTPSKARLEWAMRGHVLGRAELTGTYWRRTYGAR